MIDCLEKEVQTLSSDRNQLRLKVSQLDESNLQKTHQLAFREEELKQLVEMQKNLKL